MIREMGVHRELRTQGRSNELSEPCTLRPALSCMSRLNQLGTCQVVARTAAHGYWDFLSSWGLFGTSHMGCQQCEGQLQQPRQCRWVRPSHYALLPLSSSISCLAKHRGNPGGGLCLHPLVHGAGAGNVLVVFSSINLPKHKLFLDGAAFHRHHSALR